MKQKEYLIYELGLARTRDYETDKYFEKPENFYWKNAGRFYLEVYTRTGFYEID